MTNQPTNPAPSNPPAPDRPDGSTQIILLFVVSSAAMLIGLYMALGATGLQINLVVFGSALVTASVIAFTGAMVIQALRR